MAATQQVVVAVVSLTHWSLSESGDVAGRYLDSTTTAITTSVHWRLIRDIREIFVYEV